MLLGLYAAGAIAAAIIAWYFYQINSRRKGWLRYRVRQAFVFFPVYFGTIVVLKDHGLDQILVVVISGLVGYGATYHFVSPPKQNRRIPKGVRKAVIARDLESKGEKWDPARHHIDHKVPFSRFGDHSVRNLRVVEKEKNLSKGAKMPGFRDFIR